MLKQKQLAAKASSSAPADNTITRIRKQYKIFTDEERRVLHESFPNAYLQLSPDLRKRKQVAKKMKMTLQQVTDWCRAQYVRTKRLSQ